MAELAPGPRRRWVAPLPRHSRAYGEVAVDDDQPVPDDGDDQPREPRNQGHYRESFGAWITDSGGWVPVNRSLPDEDAED